MPTPVAGQDQTMLTRPSTSIHTSVCAFALISVALPPEGYFSMWYIEFTGHEELQAIQNGQLY